MTKNADLTKQNFTEQGARGMEEDVRKTSITNEIREKLRRAILDGEFEAGAQLRQEELAERFGASRIPVREALRQLESEGLVSLLLNKGAVVASLSWEDVSELLEIRIALECRALRLAIPNMIEDDFNTAQKILSAYDATPDPEKWSQMNWRFHESLYVPCNLPRLLGMIEANYGHLGLYLRKQVSIAAGKEDPQRDHYAILEACRHGEVDRAVRLLEDHIVRTKRAISAIARKARYSSNT